MFVRLVFVVEDAPELARELPKEEWAVEHDHGRIAEMFGASRYPTGGGKHATWRVFDPSRSFYEKFGFQTFAGNAAQKWLILKNGDHVIGLFQGMFEKNIMTFNPGWDQNAQKLDSFTDVRELQRQLKVSGVELVQQRTRARRGRRVSSRWIRMGIRFSSISTCRTASEPIVRIIEPALPGGSSPTAPWRRTSSFPG